MHAIPMLSLANAFSEEEIADFDRRIRERLELTQDVEYTAEPKVDGLAVSLIFEDGRFVRCRARLPRAVHALIHP